VLFVYKIFSDFTPKKTHLTPRPMAKRGGWGGVGFGQGGGPAGDETMQGAGSLTAGATAPETTAGYQRRPFRQRGRCRRPLWVAVAALPPAHRRISRSRGVAIACSEHNVTRSAGTVRVTALPPARRRISRSRGVAIACSEHNVTRSAGAVPATDLPPGGHARNHRGVPADIRCSVLATTPRRAVATRWMLAGGGKAACDRTEWPRFNSDKLLRTGRPGRDGAPPPSANLPSER